MESNGVGWVGGMGGLVGGSGVARWVGGLWRKRGKKRGPRVRLLPLGRCNKATDVQAEIKYKVQICKSKRTELSEDQLDLAACCLSLQSVCGSPYKFSAAARLCSRFISPCLTLLTFSFPYLQPYFSN